MADYISQYTGGQIDSAVGRALPGGTLETLIADKVPNENGEILTDTHAFSGVGWYRVDGNAANMPPNYTGVAAIMFVRLDKMAYGARYAEFDLWIPGWSGAYTPHFRQQCIGNTWKQFRWVNPPMLLGVEYCTTEDYLGKPVYAKVVDMGTLPNAALLEVNHGISNLGYIVLLNGTMRYGVNNFYIPHSSGGPAYEDFCGIGTSTVWVVTTKDRTKFSAKILIKYTKTTD